MATRTTKVRLTAQVQEYIDGMKQAARATRETGSETEKLAQQREAMELMGRTMLVAGGAMAAGLVLSTKAAIDWDSAWAGVTKTVDGSPEQLAAVEKGLRDLTGILPASHTEIAAVAEAAGQLGIQTPNVVAFTKTMIDLGETTNLSSEQAAMSLARFMNIMQTSQGDVSKLGSALVGLGNNFATTESEILEMSMRLAKSGVQIGLSEGEVLGLATALSSVGIEAEAGGSAMSKVMIDIAASVEQGGDRLEMFAKTSGMTADQFAQKWKTAPAEALAAFVKGLANAEAQGGSTLGVLAELGITEVRMRDALLGSAAAADQFAGAMAMGNEEFEKNSALTDEAEKRYETTAAKLSIMGNRVTDAAISVGEHFLPAVEAGADAVGGFADMLAGLDGPMGAVVAWGGLVTTGILLTGGAALLAVPKIAAYKVALETLEIAGSRTGRVLGNLGRVAGAVGVFAVATTAVNGFADAMNQKMMPAASETTNRVLTATTAVEAFSGVLSARFPGGENFKIATQQVNGLADALDDAASANFWEPITVKSDQLLATWRLLGKELAATDLSQASAQFKMIAEAANLSREQMQELINQSPEFRDALVSQATMMGLGSEEATLLALALGEIGPAAQTGTNGAEDQAGALEELQGVAKDTSDAVDQLADDIRNFGSAQFDVENATIKFHDALADLDEQLASGQGSLDVTTEAGRNTMSAMLDVASSTNDYAASVAAMGGSTEDVQAVLESGRQKIIATRIALGETEEQAKAYADQLIATPETIKTRADLDTANATSQYWAWRNQIEGGVITIRGQMAFAGGVNPSAALNHANGGIHAYANGGIQEFAGGGFPTGIYAGGAPIHKFAEPETGWEAYISGKADQRDRNRQIWVDAGERLGMGDVLKALSGQQGGGYAGPSELVVRDVDGSLIGRMRVEASGAVATAFDSASSSALSSRFGTRTAR